MRRTASVRDAFHTRPLGPFEVKGKREPIEAHEVLGLSEVLTPMSIAHSRGLTPLVGRAEQLAQLNSCYQRSRGRLGQVVAIVGPAGLRQVSLDLRVQAAASAGGGVPLRGAVLLAHARHALFPMDQHDSALLRPRSGRRCGGGAPQAGKRTGRSGQRRRRHRPGTSRPDPRYPIWRRGQRSTSCAHSRRWWRSSRAQPCAHPC